jgi:transcriptional regulator GlxA family with amidase domain
MSHHYHEKANISEVAEGLQLAEEYIDALFRQFKGKSAADALITYKLNGLCDRLGSNMESPIEELMIECGLAPSGRIYAIFEVHFGMSIHEYRRQYRAISSQDSE